MFLCIFALLNQILKGSVNKNWIIFFLFYTWNAQGVCCYLILFKGFLGAGVRGSIWNNYPEHITGSRISQPVWRPQINGCNLEKKLGIRYYRSYFKFTRAFARSTSLILGLRVQNIFLKAFQCVKQQGESTSHRLGAGGWICG